MSVQATSSPPRKREFRPEIEGLRVVAALLVAVFHIWVGGVSGGVDVFFVVSGFLITTTLLGQLARFKRVKVGQFLGRLATRLFPQALLVLIVTAVATWLFVPPSLRQRAYLEIASSALYFENWTLAFNSVDYLNREDPQSPVQHFWAMSIQGQFYLIWLAIFLIAGAIATLLNRNARTIVTSLLVATAAVSLTYSVWFTSVNQPFAYFSTFTRAWEFAAGGLAAIFITRITLPRMIAFFAGWVGLLGLVICGFVLPVASSFPGIVAMWPVCCALLILISGPSRETPGAANWLLGRKVMVWLGGLSYGFYLWHWVILTMMRYAFGRTQIGVKMGIAIIVMSFGLAWLSTRLLERPTLRFASTTDFSRRLTIGLATGTALVVGLASFSVVLVSETRAGQLQAASDSDPCFGARALAAAESNCAERSDASSLLPPQDLLLQDTGTAYACHTNPTDTRIDTCSLGSNSPDAVRIALVGNSHGAMLVPAIEPYLVEMNWRVDQFTGSPCVWAYSVADDECGGKLAEYDHALLEGEAYDYVLALGASSSGAGGADAQRRTWDAWTSLQERGTSVIVIEDNPRLPASVGDCVIHSTPAELVDAACEIDESAGYANGDPYYEVAAQMNISRVGTRDLYCVNEICPTVIGDVIVYRDIHHVTATYARSTGPELIERITAAMG